MSAVKRYRKRPVVIDALRFTGSVISGEQCAEWCGGEFVFDPKPSDPTDVNVSVRIPTLEGVMTASVGDYIIRGVKGEFYPCKPDVFDVSYQEDDQ